MKANRILSFETSRAAVLVMIPVMLAYTANQAHESEWIEGVAMGTALLAFPILCLQPLLSARLRWMERPFGMFRLLRFHRSMAIAAVGLQWRIRCCSRPATRGGGP